jgi:hypothetical protein
LARPRSNDHGERSKRACSCDARVFQARCGGSRHALTVVALFVFSWRHHHRHGARCASNERARDADASLPWFLFFELASVVTRDELTLVEIYA